MLNHESLASVGHLHDADVAHAVVPTEVDTDHHDGSKDSDPKLPTVVEGQSLLILKSNLVTIARAEIPRFFYDLVNGIGNAAPSTWSRSRGVHVGGWRRRVCHGRVCHRGVSRNNKLCRGEGVYW